MYTSTYRIGLWAEIINKTGDLLVAIACNFYRYFYAKNGKDTLHDAVGIVYQNIDPTPEEILKDCQTFLQMDIGYELRKLSIQNYLYFEKKT